MKILDELGVETLWEKIKNYVSGKVFNPDDEDLVAEETTGGTSVMKLADRSYSPQNFSGKGYKILRKNIKPVSLAVTKIIVSSVPIYDGYISFIINGVESHVDVVASTDTTTDKVADKIVSKLTETMTEYEVSKDASTITLIRKFGGVISTHSSFSAVKTGVSCSITDSTKKELRNIITPIMMNQHNTIYEIRYDFDLDGETIEMQEGCTLKFNGGSLNNGTLKGNITEIKALANKIFNLQLTLTGSFNNEFILSEWYGAIGNSNIDCSFAINKALNSPIKCLKLLGKQYLVESTTEVYSLVNDKNYNANIIVPNNKIIIGSGTSDYTNNSTIIVSENTMSDIALFISDRQIQISNITILGKERSDGKYSCNRLVVTQKGVANLNFRNVATRYCNSNAFDIDAYLSAFYSCSASTCKGVGFYFHSSTGHNTSIVLTKCYASSIEEEGYIFQNMDYCSLISCAADKCGCIGAKDKATYRFIGTRGISLISCGCESTHKIMECSSGVEGLNIIGCFFFLKEESSYPANYDFSKIWNLDYVVSMNVSNSIIGRLFSTKKLISATEHTNAKFENCILYKKDSSDGDILNEEIINYTFTNQEKAIKNISIRSTINKIDGSFAFDSINHYNNTFIFGYVKFNIGNSYFDSNKRLNNIQGNIKICGKIDNTYCYCTDIFKITNCNNVSLDNLKIDFAYLSNTANTAFYIEDSNVIFNNVIFNSTLDKILFKLVNSTVCFNNCTFIKKYGASYSFEQTLEIDNSSKILFNNKNLGTSTDRNNYIPLSKGSTWFDTNLNKLILWNGTNWVNLDGSELS